MQASWLIAVLLAAMASFISNLGVTLQKLHHLRLAADPRGQPDEYHQGWLWRIGLFLVFFGSLADFAALSFGPQSLVAPLGSLTLVSNVIFAPLLLKETIGRGDVLATLLIVIGSSVAVIFGSHETPSFTVFQLFGFFTRWDFILYAFVVGALIAALYLSIQKIEAIEREDGVHSPRYLHYRALHRFAYPSLSGAVGAQSVLFAKCFVELISNTARHWTGNGFSYDMDEQPLPDSSPSLIPGGNVTDALPSAQELGVSAAAAAAAAAGDHGSMSPNMFVHWQTYFVFAAMLGTIFAQIKYLNEGLKRFDASYAVPVFTSFWIILSVLSGMIFYREYRGMDGMQALMFAFGVFTTVTGVITLGGRDQAHHGHAHGAHGAHAGMNGAQAADEDDLARHGRGRITSIDGLSHAPEVRADGSINPASEPFDGYARGGRVPHSVAGSLNGSGGSMSVGGGIASPSRGSMPSALDPESDVDLDLEADVAVPVRPHSHVVHVAPTAGSSSATGVAGVDEEEESSVTEGAKLVVLEASQRISAAFSKLRGKADRDALAGLHSAVNGGVSPSSVLSSSSASSSSSHLPRHLITSHPDDARDESLTTDGEQSATDPEVDDEPLILKGKRKNNASSSAGTRHKRSSSSSVNSSSASAGGGTLLLDPILSAIPSPRSARSSAGATPTNASLFDPTATVRALSRESSSSASTSASTPRGAHKRSA